MRVVHVTPYFAPAFRYGGPPRSVLGLCQGLQRAGVNVEVVTTTANGADELASSPPEGSEYEGVAVRYVPTSFPRRFFGARLRRPLTAALERADLCHVHGLWNVPEWTATRLARSNDRPYVVSPRGMLQLGSLGHHAWRKRIGFQLLERGGLDGADLIHATSDAEAAALEPFHLSAPVTVIPNGVDIAAAAAARPGFRARLGIASDEFVVVFLGRIHPIKRLDLLADAFSELRQTCSGAHLVLAGPDECGMLAAIMSRLTAHGGFVHVLETIDDAQKWTLLRDADVLVQCSDSESFGVAIVEAMAAATAVVVTRTCPWPDIETHGCGLYVEQSVAAIAGALRQLADDPARTADMGARAAAFARERYGWEAIGRRMAAQYADVLKRRERHRAA